MDALKKINWKQPKYMIPLIIYFPLLFVGYFVIDLFHTEKAEIPDGLTTTEYPFVQKRLRVLCISCPYVAPPPRR